MNANDLIAAATAAGLIAREVTYPRHAVQVSPRINDAAGRRSVRGYTAQQGGYTVRERGEVYGVLVVGP